VTALQRGLQVPSLLGQGLGTEVTRLVLAHAFGEMRLHQVGLRVLAFNDRAVRCYESCGFRVEGRERETTRVDGEWHDDLIMGVLAPEFRA
jgi:RimJ/RimL family protein N-acetyltransferase